MTKVLIVGISGVTCGGKTTLANELRKILPNAKFISQDDYFRAVDDPKHVWIKELNHINYDILSSLDMEKLHSDIKEIVKNKQQLYSVGSNKLISDIQDINDLKWETFEQISKNKVEIVIVEGFSIFNYKPVQKYFHLKYYFTLPKDECHKRRIQRVYDPPDCPGYFELCAWPEHKKQLEQVKREVPGVKYFSGISNNALEVVLQDIMAAISCNL